MVQYYCRQMIWLMTVFCSRNRTCASSKFQSGILTVLMPRNTDTASASQLITLVRHGVSISCSQLAGLPLLVDGGSGTMSEKSTNSMPSVVPGASGKSASSDAAAVGSVTVTADMLSRFTESRPCFGLLVSAENWSSSATDASTQMGRHGLRHAETGISALCESVLANAKHPRRSM